MTERKQHKLYIGRWYINYVKENVKRQTTFVNTQPSKERNKWLFFIFFSTTIRVWRARANRSTWGRSNSKLSLTLLTFREAARVNASRWAGLWQYTWRIPTGLNHFPNIPISAVRMIQQNPTSLLVWPFVEVKKRKRKKKERETTKSETEHTQRGWERERERERQREFFSSYTIPGICIFFLIPLFFSLLFWFKAKF